MDENYKFKPRVDYCDGFDSLTLYLKDEMSYVDCSTENSGFELHKSCDNDEITGVTILGVSNFENQRLKKILKGMLSLSTNHGTEFEERPGEIIIQDGTVSVHFHDSKNAINFYNFLYEHAEPKK